MLDSIRAAAAVGPNTGTPRSAIRSAIPAASGPSGPITARSTRRSRAQAESSSVAPGSMFDRSALAGHASIRPGDVEGGLGCVRGGASRGGRALGRRCRTIRIRMAVPLCPERVHESSRRRAAQPRSSGSRSPLRRSCRRSPRRKDPRRRPGPGRPGCWYSPRTMRSYSPLSIHARISERRSTQKGCVWPSRLSTLNTWSARSPRLAVRFGLADELRERGLLVVARRPPSSASTTSRPLDPGWRGGRPGRPKARSSGSTRGARPGWRGPRAPRWGSRVRRVGSGALSSCGRARGRSSRGRPSWPST